MLDFDQKTSECKRVRSQIFPNEDSGNVFYIGKLVQCDNEMNDAKALSVTELT